MFSYDESISMSYDDRFTVKIASLFGWWWSACDLCWYFPYLPKFPIRGPTHRLPLMFYLSYYDWLTETISACDPRALPGERAHKWADMTGVFCVVKEIF